MGEVLFVGAWGSRKGRMGIVRRLSMITGWLRDGLLTHGKQEVAEAVCGGSMGGDLATDHGS